MFVISFFKNAWQYFKYKKILNDIYKNENIIENLKESVDLDFRKDWMGRLYTVVNPFIKNGKYDPDAMIFDYNDGKISLDTYVEHQFVEKMNLIQSFVISKEMFDLVTYDVKKIDKFGNFLVILEPVPYQDFISDSKKMAKLFAILLVLAGTLFAAIKYFI